MLHYQPTVANYMLPASVIKLCGKMSFVDSLWFLSDGTSFILSYQLHIQSEDVGWQERVCFDHRLPVFCVIQGWTLLRCGTEKAQREKPESIGSEMCLQCRFMLFWLCIYLFQASYSSRPLALELIVLPTITYRPAHLLQPCLQVSLAIRMDDKRGVKYWLV